MKNFIKSGLLAFIFGLAFVSVNPQSNFPYDYMTDSVNDQEVNIWKIIKTDAINPSNSVLNNLFWLFGLDSEEYAGNRKAEYYVKMVLNMVLGLVSFVSLILIIYSFYMIFFTKQEEWVAKAKKILIGVFIALAVMWLSWLIVSFIFDIYQTKI